MSNRYGPRIVTDGLVLCLDAADNNSYPGTGTTWTDLSGNGNNGTLTNGPTFNSANKGSVVFDGTNDYISNTKTFTVSTNITLCAWIYHSVIDGRINRYLTLGASESAVIRHSGSGQLHFYYLLNSILVHIYANSALVVNNWYYIVGTWDGSIGSLYKNGTLLGTRSGGGVLSSDNVDWAIGTTVQHNGEYMNGNISLISIYNRALSASEVLQNYNATKGRFNL